MAETILRTVPRQTLAANTVIVTPSSVWPSGVRWVRLDFDPSDADQRDPASVLTLAFEASLDAGATWVPWGSATTQGSLLRDPATQHPSLTVRRLPPAGALVRARLMVGSQPVTCGFVVTVDT